MGGVGSQTVLSTRNPEPEDLKNETRTPKIETLFWGLRVGFRKATLSVRQGVKFTVSHGGSTLRSYALDFCLTGKRSSA